MVLTSVGSGMYSIPVIVLYSCIYVTTAGQIELLCLSNRIAYIKLLSLR